MQAEKIIRLAKHAGTWYTQNKAKLNQELENYLSKAQTDQDELEIKAIIGPHAGFTYSGPVAAWSYKYFLNKSQKYRIFLLGPSHHKFLQGISLSSCTQLETPLGNLQVDTETIQKLRCELKNTILTKKDEERQHSLEMHMPYIHKIFGQNSAVVPIIVGNLTEASAEQYGKKLAPYFDDPKTIFITSSDFCHWGEHFEYQPYDQNNKLKIWEYISKLDHEGIKLIEKNDTKQFFKYLNQTGNTICGQNPIKLMMSSIKNSKNQFTTKFVQYDQSQKVTVPDQSSVSYAASITFKAIK